MESNKIICASWIGRFGNRCHSYLYGKHIEQKFGQKFYVGAKWDGSVLFNNPAPVVNSNFSQNSFIYAGGAWKGKDYAKNKKIIDTYNQKYNDSIEFIDPVLQKNTEKPKLHFISLVTDCNWFYEQVNLSDLKQYFAFSDEVKQTDMYKELKIYKEHMTLHTSEELIYHEKIIRGGHSMVSRQSYLDAFAKFDQDPSKVVWVSDERKVGWNYDKEIPKIGGRTIPWLDDF